MNRVIKGNEPKGLKAYRERHPQNSWKQFKKYNKEYLRELQRVIRQDQGGLCAYCEIDVMPRNVKGGPDARIEHFHPKSDMPEEAGHNWHLDWQNLLSCCHGGTRPNVADAKRRYTSPDHSCDVPKSDKNLEGVILNPLTIPAFPALFEYSRQGQMTVHEDNCKAAAVNVQLAEQSIEELRLNSQRLIRLRNAELNALNDAISNMLKAGLTIDQATENLARGLLKKDEHGNWPRFFSAIRSYLGNASEKQLKAINYQG